MFSNPKELVCLKKKLEQVRRRGVQLAAGRRRQCVLVSGAQSNGNGFADARYQQHDDADDYASERVSYDHNKDH